LPPVAPSTTEDLPLFLEADRLQGYQGREVEAVGDVVVRRRGQVVYTDRLHYSVTENSVRATGHVRVERLGDVVTGSEAYIDLDNGSGWIEAPTYRFRQFGARGSADRLIIRDRDRYRAERATYTNCDVGDDDWYLHVDRLDLDRLRDTGVARNATFRFKGVPIMYTPWLDFPLTSRRKTGFLPPSFGPTSRSGFEIELPFYWNIAPNRDYTFAPRLLSRRGLLLNNEFRYLEPKLSGEARFDYLPEDRVFNDSRWAYAFKHNQQITDRLTGALNLQGVSDDSYFVDLSDSIASTSQTNLPREGSLSYYGDWWNVLARAQRFQTLQDPLAPPVDPPYARMPQVALNAAQPNVHGVDLSFFGELVSFEHPTKINGIRQVYYPYLSVPYRNRLFYVRPKVGLNYTRYSFPDSDTPDQTRTLPIFSVDSGMRFDRNTVLGGQDFLQTLEPRLYYVYIPFRRQDQLPVFDTAEADFDLARIFTENQFSGWDRINNADQITAAITTRLIVPGSGNEWIRATLGQRYYFEDQEVALNGQVRASNRSDVLAGVTGALTPTWSLNLGYQYNVDDSQTKKFNVALRHQPQLGKVLNIGYRFTRDQLEQVDLSGQWPLARGWSGVARWNYSLQDNTTLEALAGLEYNAGCWSARVVGHRFVTSTDEQSTSLFFQVEFRGVSRLGQNPVELLRRNIGGYARVPSRPPDTAEIYPGMDVP
jgi:LPS-assembly protein